MSFVTHCALCRFIAPSLVFIYGVAFHTIIFSGYVSSRNEVSLNHCWAVLFIFRPHQLIGYSMSITVQLHLDQVRFRLLRYHLRQCDHKLTSGTNLWWFISIVFVIQWNLLIAFSAICSRPCAPGRCIKPNICLCEGGTVSSSCPTSTQQQKPGRKLIYYF